MQRIRHAAEVSIRRGLAFTGLAIGTMMIGLSFNPVLALQTGAGLSCLAGAVLAFKGLSAPARNFRHTEVWILLERKTGLSNEAAQRVIGGVLRDVYLRYATTTAYVAAGMWVFSLAMRFAI